MWSGGLDALLAGHGRDGSTEVRWTPLHDEHTHEHHDQPRDQADEPVRRPPPYLPAPGVDGRCVRCGGSWPCLDCGL